jgi:lysophospholipase L1-like esterase
MVFVVAAALLVLVSLATAADEKAPGAEKGVKVLMLGDSVTLLGMPRAVNGPINELTKGKTTWTMLNGGQGGDIAAGGRDRVGKLLADDKPDVITISFGLNEVSTHYSPEKFKTDMEGLLEVIAKESPATKVILLTTTPMNINYHMGDDKVYNAEGGVDVVLDTKFNGVTRKLAAEKQLPLIDVHRYFLTDKNWARQYISPGGPAAPDGVHLRTDDGHNGYNGYDFIGPYLAKAIAAWYETESAKDPQGVSLRDKMVRRLKKVAAKADEAKDSATRQKLLAELDEIWQTTPWLAAPSRPACWPTSSARTSFSLTSSWPTPTRELSCGRSRAARSWPPPRSLPLVTPSRTVRSTSTAASRVTSASPSTSGPSSVKSKWPARSFPEASLSPKRP